MRSALGDVPLEHVMRTDVRVLDADLPLQAAVRASVAGAQRDFPIVAHGRLVGVLWQEDLLRGLQELGPDARIGECTDRAVCQAHLGERVEAVLQRLASCGERLLPVTDAVGQLVGVITPDAMNQFLRIQAAMRR